MLTNYFYLSKLIYTFRQTNSEFKYNKNIIDCNNETFNSSKKRKREEKKGEIKINCLSIVVERHSKFCTKCANSLEQECVRCSLRSNLKTKFCSTCRLLTRASNFNARFPTRPIFVKFLVV